MAGAHSSPPAARSLSTATCWNSWPSPNRAHGSRPHWHYVRSAGHKDDAHKLSVLSYRLSGKTKPLEKIRRKLMPPKVDPYATPLHRRIDTFLWIFSLVA